MKRMYEEFNNKYTAEKLAHSKNLKNEAIGYLKAMLEFLNHDVTLLQYERNELELEILHRIVKIQEAMM